VTVKKRDDTNRGKQFAARSGAIGRKMARDRDGADAQRAMIELTSKA
jgi:hypothetical protein